MITQNELFISCSRENGDKGYTYSTYIVLKYSLPHSQTVLSDVQLKFDSLCSNRTMNEAMSNFEEKMSEFRRDETGQLSVHILFLSSSPVHYP